MKKYADIIVNISHEALDKTFQYEIPDCLLAVVEVGSYVRIPFGNGNKEITGYVLNISDKPSFDVNRIKSIAGVETGGDLVEAKLIKLAYFLKSNYGSTMITALKTVLPIKKKVKEKKIRTVSLVLSENEAKEKLNFYIEKHQKARARLLEELINEKDIDYSLIVNKLNVSAKTMDVMVEQGVIEITEKRVYRNSVNGGFIPAKNTLNEDQRKIADEVITDLNGDIKKTYLIRGVTGSGKTEIYMEIIDAVVEKGQQAIVLIPEISLTYQTVMRFQKRYGDRVSTLHSKLSAGEKYDQFLRAKNGEIDVMIGPRSALFTPFSNIGVIIMDEEHEQSYKSEQMPKYHAREVAIELARLHNASVVLGSATPSIESFYKARNGEFKLFELDRRAKASELATTSIVDLREELKAGNKAMFSRELYSKIEDRLMKNQQVMLFLNRRGYAGAISCRACGEVIKCPHCDVSLSQHGKYKMMCHYCGYETRLVDKCPTCGSTYVGGMKAGTEKVEESVKKAFPFARVLRMDADTTKTKDSYENILAAFANKEADILVGTQMIVKGHDFPDVTLVGILVADMSLHVNDYRASERTFQLITQAAGRAGRSELKGEVVIQTYSPDNYSIVAAGKQDYNAFYQEEIDYRDMLMYPPVGHMLAILIESLDERFVKNSAQNLAERLKNVIMKRSLQRDIRVIGPAEATISKINEVYRQVIYLKSRDYDKLTFIKDFIESMEPDKRIRITFDFDPMSGY